MGIIIAPLAVGSNVEKGLLETLRVMLKIGAGVGLGGVMGLVFSFSFLFVPLWPCWGK